MTSQKRTIVCICRPKFSSSSRISHSFGNPWFVTHFADPFLVLRELIKAFWVFVLGMEMMSFGMNYQCSVESLVIKHLVVYSFLMWMINFLLNYHMTAQSVVDNSKSCRNTLLDGYSWAYRGKVLKSKGNRALKSSQHIDQTRSICIDHNSILLALILVVGAFVCGLGYGTVFDSTCGYPGEGPVSDWSNKHPNLSMTTWNTRSLTFERF